MKQLHVFQDQDRELVRKKKKKKQETSYFSAPAGLAGLPLFKLLCGAHFISEPLLGFPETGRRVLINKTSIVRRWPITGALSAV